MALTTAERAQYEHEIDWIQKKIQSLSGCRSAFRQIGDLHRQIRERELSLAFNDFVGRK